MLGADEYTAGALLEYLSILDLDATAPLCKAAKNALHRQFTQIYRPDSNDPRPYRELLSRLGGDAQFSALIWLAEHRCEPEEELIEAEDLM
jgi:hypothetical protein